jgi:hypothetical protein
MEDPKPIRSIHGIAQDSEGKPLDGVLVEVYDHPEIALASHGMPWSGQMRLAGCKTDETGLFSFRMRSGDYEIRFSKSIEWNVTSYRIKVRRTHLWSQRRLRIWLHLAL